MNTIEFLEETAVGPGQDRSRVTPKGLRIIASGRVGKSETGITPALSPSV